MIMFLAISTVNTLRTIRKTHYFGFYSEWWKLQCRQQGGELDTGRSRAGR